MIKKEFPEEDKKTRMKAHAGDRRYHFFLSGGDVRGVLVHGSRMIREMKLNHDLGVLETIVLGQAYLGTVLMAAGLKEEGLIQLKVECGGPLQGLSVEVELILTVQSAAICFRTPFPLKRHRTALIPPICSVPDFFRLPGIPLKRGNLLRERLC